MKITIRYYFIIIYILLAIVLAGCNAPKDQLEVFNRYLESGRYQDAYRFALCKYKNRQPPQGEDILWALHLGSLERLEGRFDQSTLWFDRAEEGINYYLAHSEKIIETIGSVTVNDNLIPYYGTIYDGIWVNTYKALNFLQQGDFQLARVEFNRALERQRRAKEEFISQIQKRQEALRQQQYFSMASQLTASQELKNTPPQPQQNLPPEFAAYPDFVNPFTTYLAGIFFAAVGDYSRAYETLRETAGMLPYCQTAQADFSAVERVATQGGQLEPTVWVIYENGLGPIKKEFRVDLPLFIATDKVRYVGIALPYLEFRAPAAIELAVQTGGTRAGLEFMASNDRIIQTEFDQQFVWIATRAIMSAAIKAAGQYALERNDATAAAIALAVYQFATTAADVRIWSALPKNIHIGRFPMPADHLVVVYPPTGRPLSVYLDSTCRYAMVYVRQLTAATAPTVDVIRF